MINPTSMIMSRKRIVSGCIVRKNRAYAKTNLTAISLRSKIPNEQTTAVELPGEARHTEHGAPSPSSVRTTRRCPAQGRL
jgi:hypothetical protein